MWQKINTSLLSKSINKSGLQAKVQISLALQEVNNILDLTLPQEIRKQAQPMYIKDGCLYIKVTDSIISSLIKRKENEIIERVNPKVLERIQKIIYII